MKENKKVKMKYSSNEMSLEYIQLSTDFQVLFKRQSTNQFNELNELRFRFFEAYRTFSLHSLSRTISQIESIQSFGCTHHKRHC